MSKVYRTVLEVSWGLGVICTVAVIVLKVLPVLQDKLNVSTHGGILVAAILFLCVLATGEVRKTLPPS
jgi:hypothetical protein